MFDAIPNLDLCDMFPGFFFTLTLDLLMHVSVPPGVVIVQRTVLLAEIYAVGRVLSLSLIKNISLKSSPCHH